VVQVLVATHDGLLAFDEDGHRTVELDGRPVTSIARDGSDCWAVLERRTLLRRGKGGAWDEVLAPEGPDVTAVLPRPGGVLVGTADAHLLRILDGKAARVDGFDDVEGRDTWHAVPSGTPYVRSITTTADDRALLASVHVGGIARSGNGGKTWQPTVDVEIDVHEVRAHPTDPHLVLAAAGYGFAVSRDAGKTWSVTTDGLYSPYCRAVAFTATGALVSASDGPFGKKAAVYRWSPDGGPPERCTDGLPEWLAGNVDTRCIDTTRDLAVFADHDAVWVSRDDGGTWEHRADLGRGAYGVAILAA